jgi:hypothetical protein
MKSAPNWLKILRSTMLFSVANETHARAVGPYNLPPVTCTSGTKS